MIINRETLADLQAIDDDAFIERVLNVLAGPSFEAMVVCLKAIDKAMTPRREHEPREERQN